MDDVTFIINRFEKLKSERTTWEREWQEIVELVRPGASDFTRAPVQGQSRNDQIYDGTAPDANEELAAGLHSYLTNPTDRWFSLVAQEKEAVENDWEALRWLDEVTDIIFAAYSDERSGFNSSLHECYQDLGAFGTAILEQEYRFKGDGHLVFRAFPLAQCYILDNSDGLVDTLYRTLKWTRRQCMQEFKALPSKMNEEKNDDREFSFVHAVYPRSDRNPKMAGRKNMKYASVWICLDTKEMLNESGYLSFPYHIPRWSKLSSEIYGRSPAKKCLPDIKMLNAMEKIMIKAGQKQVDPPLVVPNDGFMLPIKTSPGSIIFSEPGMQEKMYPLETGANLSIGIEMSNQKREFIKKCFYNDYLKMAKENKEMTATEVMDRRDEKLRLLAPMLGRLQMELLQPMIVRTYELLQFAGKIPPAPLSMQNKTMQLQYSSAASRAQTGVKAMAISRYLQEMIPFAQMDPTVMDAINGDKVAMELAESRGTPRSILRSPKDIQAIRDSRAQQQQVQQMATVAEPASKAIKNLADASAAGGMGL